MKFVLEQCDNGNFNKAPNICNFGGKLSCFALQMVIHHFAEKTNNVLSSSFSFRIFMISWWENQIIKVIVIFSKNTPTQIPSQSFSQKQD